ncbi:siderophore-interacting protein [Streptoalloteichus hindustanus]|uniref:NADPH-dependent ferric siderophore reductase, contains FAD-binding and SIP domains n=1 Tax=Streptoalloteichus hindustanus TaxID=2017 RepID=A0A1M5ABE0_STRHI|nr:siderophore-interacting protein [Streptoalloteichus hindustanus]SHF27366.1 NADPH-dependent ferric siderophore reductase, contains FAD-binding and SIP domains [Streptoalloteichus hindustanus]
MTEPTTAPMAGPRTDPKTEPKTEPGIGFSAEVQRQLAQIRTYLAPVLRVEQVTPKMTRVRVGGPELTGFAGGRGADEHIKLIFPAPGERVPVLPTFTPNGLRYPEGVPPSHARSYTVRRYDPLTNELDVDFVIHGHGAASEWARLARPGDQLGIAGPKGGFLPSDDADLHLLVGDDSALPAIATILEHMPPGAAVRAVIEVADADEEQELATEATADVQWLHRSAVGTPSLVEVVRSLTWPSGLVHAWVAGEAGVVRDLRRHLLRERGMERGCLRATGYWRQGKTTDEWAAEDMVKLRAALAEGRVTEAQVLRGEADLDD